MMIGGRLDCLILILEGSFIGPKVVIGEFCLDGVNSAIIRRRVAPRCRPADRLLDAARLTAEVDDCPTKEPIGTHAFLLLCVLIP